MTWQQHEPNAIALHYHGYAGNRATISRAEFTRKIAAIFPGKNFRMTWHFPSTFNSDFAFQMKSSGILSTKSQIAECHFNLLDFLPGKPLFFE
ncbi:MAG: hypothetical protein ACI92Z_003816 [Paracoccaceae bacterium]